jgi:hypothetical protein
VSPGGVYEISSRTLAFDIGVLGRLNVMTGEMDDSPGADRGRTRFLWRRCGAAYSAKKECEYKGLERQYRDLQLCVGVLVC